MFCHRLRTVKYIAWDAKKNERLRIERGISFEDVIEALLGDGLVKTIRHPNAKKYPHQYIHIIEIKAYIYIVPFIEDKEKYLFKTIIPSRKATKIYMVSKKGGI